jgi:hypothetical protein
MGRAGEHMAHHGECEAAEEPHAALLALLATFPRFLPLGQGANERWCGAARVVDVAAFSERLTASGYLRLCQLMGDGISLRPLLNSSFER